MSTPRIVVLTGVTRGLGRAMLKELVAAGCTVAGCGRNREHIETIRREYPAPHRFASVDVSDDFQVSSWAVHILDTMGAPDLLINNAALVNTTSSAVSGFPSCHLTPRRNLKV